jgi:exonuclease III
MNILFRNVRGLNMPLKQKEVRKMVRRLIISILCVVETRVKQENFSKIVVSMLPG